MYSGRMTTLRKVASRQLLRGFSKSYERALFVPSYDHGTTMKKLIGTTIGHYFDQQVKLHGDVEALVVKHQNIRWTYKQLAEKVNTVAKRLLAIGIRPGTSRAQFAINIIHVL